MSGQAPRPMGAREVDHRAVRRALRRWYREAGRHDLPWRQARDPYAVLVSEVMLQQTQVERVVPYYQQWLARWPTLEALAAAPTAEVIRAWSGLGYNRRAVNLQRAARAAVERFGRLPGAPERLRELPGIGDYTANAVACFAHGRRVPVLDTNVGRVVGRAVLGAANPRDVGTGELRAAATELLPARNARSFNLALMDLGATVCTARRPACDACPLARHCRWLANGAPESASERRPTVRFEETARFARGRIVELLRREGAMDEDQLRDRLPDDHAEAMDRYLAALESDGLVARTGPGWALP